MSDCIVREGLGARWYCTRELAESFAASSHFTFYPLNENSKVTPSLSLFAGASLLFQSCSMRARE